MVSQPTPGLTKRQAARLGRTRVGIVGRSQPGTPVASPNSLEGVLSGVPGCEPSRTASSTTRPWSTLTGCGIRRRRRRSALCAWATPTGRGHTAQRPGSDLISCRPARKCPYRTGSFAPRFRRDGVGPARINPPDNPDTARPLVPLGCGTFRAPVATTGGDQINGQNAPFGVRSIREYRAQQSGRSLARRLRRGSRFCSSISSTALVMDASVRAIEVVGFRVVWRTSAIWPR